MKKKFINIILLILVSSCSKSEFEIDNQKSSYVIWQLPSVMMSYIIETKNDSIIIIDGGNEFDAGSLHHFLKAHHFTHVNAWFITHPHDDHSGALTRILNDPKYEGLIIDNIYASLPSETQIRQFEPQCLVTYLRLQTALKNTKRTITELSLRRIMELDGIKIEILGIKNPEILNNYLNNSSLVMRFSDSVKSLLFTGDLGVEGGDKILNDSSICIESDYVQMAHHGSLGVSKEFYIKVSPKYCLWPTPKWLWNNDSGKGYNTGNYTTLEVRRWMDEQGIIKNYLMADGISRIE